MAFHVVMFENQGLSPAVTMAQKMHMELLDKNLVSPSVMHPVWNDPALVAYDKDIPVGTIVYRYVTERATWFILSAYVEPEYRRMGVHTLLFSTLIERARIRGDILAIESGTHVNNHASIASMKKQGRVAVSINFDYRLKDFEAPLSPLEMKPNS